MALKREGKDGRLSWHVRVLLMDNSNARRALKLVEVLDSVRFTVWLSIRELVRK